MKKNKIGTNILIASLAISGIISISCGAVLNKLDVGVNQEIKIKVIEKSLADNSNKTNIPKLKELTIEENMPLSVNIRDYIENISEIEETVLTKFKLDTSLVNVKESGKYTYTIIYKDKKYNGVINVIKKNNSVDNLTLKEIKIELGNQLSNNISDFVNEPLTDEMKNTIKIDLGKVNTSVIGTYQYIVIYNDKTYTGNIIVYEAKPDLSTNKKEEEKTEEKVETPQENTTSTPDTTDTNTDQTTNPTDNQNQTNQ